MDALRQINQHLSDIPMVVARLLVWLVLLAAIFVPLERWFALSPARVFRSGWRNDLFYYFVNAIVPMLVLSVPLAVAAWVGHRIIPGGVAVSFAHLPVGPRIFIALAVAEVGLYWGHRWSHEIPLLWRFHAVHHSPTHVDWLVNSRGHPVDFMFNRFCGLFPLFLLGLAAPLNGAAASTVMLVMLLGPTWGFFYPCQCAVAVWTVGVADRVAGVPSLASHQRQPGGDQQNYARCSHGSIASLARCIYQRAAAGGLWYGHGGGTGVGRAVAGPVQALWQHRQHGFGGGFGRRARGCRSRVKASANP